MCSDPDIVIVEVTEPSQAAYLDLILAEGKAFGTMRSTHKMRDTIVDIAQSISPEVFRRERKQMTSNVRKRFKRILDRSEKEILGFINEWIAGDISFKKMSENAKKVIRRGYDIAFTSGLRSSGSFSAQTRADIPEMTDEDLAYVRSATREELKYFNRFLEAIKTGSSRGRKMERRLRMYLDAMGSMFMSGRVLGTPGNHAIFWVSKLDSATCASCRYLAENSPYTKETLPTTPAAGTTQCLTNDRCVLVMRKTSENVMRRILRTGRTRGTHLKKLKKIKDRRL